VTVQELTRRFPEIPADLHAEPALARFAEACGPLLRQAVKPSNCSTHHDASNHYYLKLVGPLAIYGYGLASKEKILGQLAELAGRAEADPRAFAASLVPGDASPREVKGPGCG